jgi:hypothetical protein
MTSFVEEESIEEISNTRKLENYTVNPTTDVILSVYGAISQDFDNLTAFNKVEQIFIITHAVKIF